jgi:hypothetical protein
VSLQSSQYDFVKSLFAKEPQQEVPEKNWVVRWRGIAYPVYAINHQGGTIYADEKGLLVSFDGWQVTEFSFFSQGRKKTLIIENAATNAGSISLEYGGSDGRQFAGHTCQQWSQGSNDDWKQDCEVQGISDVVYTNVIRLNREGELVSLVFLVSPDEPMIEIELM